MSTTDPEPFDETRPVPVVPPAAPPPGFNGAEPADLAPPVRPGADPSEVLYVPLAVTVGDGFKFGCGFFLAAGLGVLLLVVVLAAIFALTSVLGLSLPVGR